MLPTLPGEVIEAMSQPRPHERLLETLFSIRRHSRWELESTTPLEGDIGHPQGLTVHDGNWWVTTVHPSTARGSVLSFDHTGHRIRDIDVTDGERIHPGGFDFPSVGDAVRIPVAEYRPHSTSTVIELDDGRVTKSFDFNDHLGAICDLGDGTLLAASWGSRVFHRLSHEGTVIERRRNPSHMVDCQDFCVITPGFVLASGVAQLSFEDEVRQLGGLLILDTRDLSIVHEVPVTATMPSGRPITYNGFHVEWSGDRALFHCLVDDTQGSIGHWTVS